jgi:hypothetical protein
MSYFPKSEYKIKEFSVSNKKNKKYDVILENKKTKKTKTLSFGDFRYQHYKDKVLGVYSYLDHNDKKRRDRYHKRHIGFIKHGYYSPGYFSLMYLW